MRTRDGIMRGMRDIRYDKSKRPNGEPAGAFFSLGFSSGFAANYLPRTMRIKTD
jgi:hypothetical protein